MTGAAVVWGAGGPLSTLFAWLLLLGPVALLASLGWLLWGWAGGWLRRLFVDEWEHAAAHRRSTAALRRACRPGPARHRKAPR